ncbi:hypothetical protein M3Y96_00424900 [Aphelenchoides besseyi]|nr:hypothetical protein M3Y96_00424900 [Aphelenchoides besseyi]
MSILSTSAVYSECDADCKFQRCVRLLVVVSFVSSSLLLPLMIYMVVVKSQQMRKYRWYLLNTIVWCYVFDFIIFLTHPIPVFPTTCVLFVPIVEMSQNLTVFAFYVGMFSLINLDLSILWTLLFRFTQVFPNKLNHYFENSKSIYLLYLFVHLFVYVTMFLTIAFGQEWNWNQTRSNFLSQNPVLIAYVNQPMVCFKNEDHFRFYHFCMSIMLIFFFFVGNALHGLLLHVLYKTRRNSVIQSTFRLQMMLFRAFTWELFIAYILLLFPFAIQGLLVYYKFEHTDKITVLNLALMSLHGTIDNLTMLYFISPWYKTITGWIRRRSNKRILICPIAEVIDELQDPIQPCF